MPCCYLPGLVSQTQNVNFRNVVFKNSGKELSKSECVNFFMHACSNIQHLYNLKFINCKKVVIQKCDVMQDAFRLFTGGEALEHLEVSHNFRLDDEVIRYLALESPFDRIQTLNLSRNRIGF